jgi:hypothetical protein
MLDVRYKCHCMGEEVEVLVPPRPEGADIAIWMSLLSATLALDHNVRSPNCKAETMEYVKVPLVEGLGVGMEQKLQS